MAGPAWTNQIQNVVVVAGPTGAVVGVFVYAPGTTPALGNLPVAWMTDGTKDPFGNVLPAIQVVSLNTATSAYAALHNGSVQVFPGSGTAAGTMFAGTGFLELDSPAESGLDTAGKVDLFSHLASPLTAGNPAFQFTNVVPYLPSLTGIGQWVAQDPASVGTAETWHAMTLANGWTNDAGFAVAAYRLTNNNEVEIVGTIVATTATSSTFFTLPAGYRPAHSQTRPAGATGGVAAGTAPFITCTSAGVLSENNVGIGAANILTFGCTFSLDA
jgi:hypothetical protein